MQPFHLVAPGPATSTSWEVGMLQSFSARWRFPSVLVSVSPMRRGLRGFLAATVLSDDEIQDLVLAASEAANNAIEHAQQPTEPFFEVCTEFADGEVTIVIQDHGRWLQPRTSPSSRGRGLAMMRALADTTVTARSHGTMVTIRTRLAGFGALVDEASAS